MQYTYIKTQRLVVIVLLLASFVTTGGVSKYAGTWFGKMIIPDGPELRIGLEVFKKANDQWGGNVASLDQGSRYIAVSDLFEKEGYLNVQLANMPISLTLKKENEDLMKGNFQQGNNSFALELSKVEMLPELKGSNAELNSNFIEKEIKFKNSTDGTWLAGTMSVPVNRDNSPSIILIAGSGPSHRDAYFLGHRPFALLANYFASQEYVVLRFDKRGVYKSGGEFSEGAVELFASDVSAAIEFLKSQGELINDEKINLIGHSEGSLVAAMLAAKQKVNTVTSLAGPGVQVLDVILAQDQTEPRAKGASEKDIKVLLSFSQKFYQTVLDSNNEVERAEKLNKLYQNLQGDEAKVINQWNDRTGTLNVSTASKDSFKRLLQQDPQGYWAKVDEPVLILNGHNDSQVPAAENTMGIYLSSTSSTDKKVIIYPNLNHMFQNSNTGSTDEYEKIEETFSEQVMRDIKEWLNLRNK